MKRNASFLFVGDILWSGKVRVASYDLRVRSGKCELVYITCKLQLKLMSCEFDQFLCSFCLDKIVLWLFLAFASLQRDVVGHQ